MKFACPEKRLRAPGMKATPRNLQSRASVEMVQNGDGYEIRPSGSNTGDSRLGFDMEILVPKKAQLTVRS